MKDRIIKIYRGILTVLFTTLFGVGALFIRYFIFPFEKGKMKNYETLQKSWKFFIRILELVGLIRVETKDLEKLQNIKNSIIVSTHPSFIDIVILMSIIPHSTCFVADKLTRNPFFKGMVKLLFISEGQSVDVWLEEACQKLKDGVNIIIFPMGTRHKRDEHPKMRKGAAMIAQKSKENIIAIKLTNNVDFLPGKKPIYEAENKISVFNIEYAGTINTQEFLDKFPDEVTFKKEVTKIIDKYLFD